MFCIFMSVNFMSVNFMSGYFVSCPANYSKFVLHCHVRQIHAWTF